MENSSSGVEMNFYLIWNKFILYYKKVSIGKNVTINGKIYCHGNKGKIYIGDNCIINSSEKSNNTAGGNHTHLVACGNGSITIGNNVGMSQVNIVSYNKIVIEDNVLLGACVKIWDTDFHSLDYKQRLREESAENAENRPIYIGEGSFIGACSIILKGVRIGKHCVIGAGSVVTKNIPDDEVWAGNPIKFIRKLEK